jgi:hypothetical protein
MAMASCTHLCINTFLLFLVPRIMELETCTYSVGSMGLDLAMAQVGDRQGATGPGKAEG